MSKLARFFSPKSVALYGSAWAANVIQQLQRGGYKGEIWPVHPSRQSIAGVACYASTNDLPGAPDCAFVGVNRNATLDVIAALSQAGAGGAICFASGFSEHTQGDGQNLQAQLLRSAGDMPVLGPNCYGFLNYLDDVALWPDQHGGEQVDSGVAILAQSSNVAINMSMQRRGLPISHIVTLGNQAQMGASQIMAHLLNDSRVSAIGLYLEGFDDLTKMHKVALAAHAKGKPIVALKIGKSEKGKLGSLTHTASLAGSAAVASALFERLGIVEVNDVTTFLEALKLLHFFGPLPNNQIASVSCSGGEASLMADLADSTQLQYPDFEPSVQQTLADVLGSQVDIANPLDYHTYIWGDVPIMVRCFETVMQSDVALCAFVLDLPRSDRCDPAGHRCAVEAIIEASRRTNKKTAVISLLGENLEPEVVRRFAAANVITLHGMETALAALDAAVTAGRFKNANLEPEPVWQQCDSENTVLALNEFDAKHRLQEFRIAVPNGRHFELLDEVRDQGLRYPLVLKALNIAHKTEVGAVIINISNAAELTSAKQSIATSDTGYLLEEMIPGTVAELIVGVTVDQTGLFAMTIGAGGVLTELLSDTATVVLPASQEVIQKKLATLRVSKLLAGYRGSAAGNPEAVVDTIMQVQAFVAANLSRLRELDINPLLVTADGAIAVDALLIEYP